MLCEIYIKINNLLSQQIVNQYLMASELKHPRLAQLGLVLHTQSHADLTHNKSQIDFDSPVSERRKGKQVLAVSSGFINPAQHHTTQTSLLNAATPVIGSFTSLLSHTPNTINKFQGQGTSPLKTAQKRLWTPKPLENRPKRDTSRKLLTQNFQGSVPTLPTPTRQRLPSPPGEQPLPAHQSRLFATQRMLSRSASKQSMPQLEENLSFTPGVTRIKLHDQEELKHSIQLLKINYNQLQEENLRLKTKNIQLENLVTTLYKDLNQQKLEIQEIYAGKPIKTQFLQSSIAQGLKRQLRQERASRKLLADELEQIKKNLKQTSHDELQAQLQLYQSELVRMRALLDKSLDSTSKNPLQLLTMSQEGSNLHQQLTIDKQKNELNSQTELIECLRSQLDQLRNQTQKTTSSRSKSATKDRLRARANPDLPAAKCTKVKQLNEQLNEVNLKMINYDQILKSNLDLTKQVNDMTSKLDKTQKMLHELSEQRDVDRRIRSNQHSYRAEAVQTATFIKNSSRAQLHMPLDDIEARQRNDIYRISRCEESDNQIEQQIVVEETQRANQDNNLINSQIEEQISLQVPQSFVRSLKGSSDRGSGGSDKEADAEPRIRILKPPFDTSQQLTNYELIVNGIKIFKSIQDYSAFLPSAGDPQPQRLYFIFEKQIKDLLSKINNPKLLTADLLQKVYQDKLSEFKSTLLVEQTHSIVDRWSQYSEDEVQVCTLVHKMLIPCIREDQMIDLPMLYEMVEMQLTQLKEDEWIQSQKAQLEISEHIERQEDSINMRATEPKSKEGLSIVEELPMTPQMAKKTSVSQNNFETESELQRRRQRKSLEEQHPSKSRNSLKYSSFDDDEFEEGDEVAQAADLLLENFNKSLQNSNRAEPSANQNLKEQAIKGEELVQEQDQQLSEEQYLYTAETVLSQLAHRLLENDWSVREVFGEPPEILQDVKDYRSGETIRVLTPQNFLGRIYQAGIQDLTQNQVTCVMYILGKPEFDDGVRYDELESLLENFGVQKDRKILPQVLKIEDKQSIHRLNEDYIDEEIPQMNTGTLDHMSAIEKVSEVSNSTHGSRNIDESTKKLLNEVIETQNEFRKEEKPINLTYQKLKNTVQTTPERAKMNSVTEEASIRETTNKSGHHSSGCQNQINQASPNKLIILDEDQEALHTSSKEILHTSAHKKDPSIIMEEEKEDTVQKKDSPTPRSEHNKTSPDLEEMDSNAHGFHKAQTIQATDKPPKNYSDGDSQTLKFKKRLGADSKNNSSNKQSSMYEQCKTDTELDAITRFSGNAKTTYSTNRFKKAIRTVNRTRKTYLAIAGILNEKQMKEYEQHSMSQKRSEHPYQSEGQSPIKDPRGAMRERISRDYKCGVFELVKNVLEHQTARSFERECIGHSYNQVIKSQSKTTETQIITQDDFFAIVDKYTDSVLGEEQLKLLQQCLQLTTKHPHLYMMKHVHNLIQDIENQLRIRNPK